MRILLVEDEKTMAAFILKGLVEEGYGVDLAENGPDGVDMAMGQAYDLIVLDVMLPGFDGFESLRRLRKGGLSTPVLMLTALSTTQDKVKGLDLGADDYLTKPFTFDEFLARVRAMLRRVASPISELKAGNLKLDPLSHKVYLSGQAVELRPKEYAILEMLVRNANQVVTRARILDKVWGYDFYPSTNVVDAQIKHLRRQLAEIDPVPVIRTIRGAGYMVEND